ncbi:cytochrome c2 [Acidovorax sp. CF316]|uniref:c-type cytochrome n=1 Tax=Acidovorax sp. CF316 TaxID=1144317 RepID=UPI00026BD3CE|nr:c-type cytochrome [Acidovorax sp. CF316]EJE51751.1 cytochrome c2 [Acidovorax sp. CF316]
MPHRRTVYATIFATMLAVAVLAAAAGFATVYLGLYNVAASEQHFKPLYQLLETAMHQSVKLRARTGVDEPPPFDEAMVLRGAGCYRDQCLQCHGGPGVPQGDIGKSMQPLPGPLVDAARRWSAREMYWLTRHGIRMSGMPAWEHRMDEEELWSTVAFLQRLPDLDVAAFRQITVEEVDGARRTGTIATCGAARMAAAPPAMGNAVLGRQALYQHACNACHMIPGVTGPEVHVGPSLAGFAARTNIASVLPHTAENLERWLREPQAVKPGTAMPAMGVSPADARHIAAYLAELK